MESCPTQRRENRHGSLGTQAQNLWFQTTAKGGGQTLGRGLPEKPTMLSEQRTSPHAGREERSWRNSIKPPHLWSGSSHTKSVI